MTNFVYVLHRIHKVIPAVLLVMSTVLYASQVAATARQIQASCPADYSLLGAPMGLCFQEYWDWRPLYYVDFGFWGFWIPYYERQNRYAPTSCPPDYPVMSSDRKLCYELNAAPVAYSRSIKTYEDRSKQVTLTATDDDGDSLDFNIVNYPSNGNLSGAGTNWTYTPDAKWNGTDSFSFIVSDGLATSSSADITIQVAPLIPLNTALDNNSLDWLSNGSDVWFGQSDITNDGSDAAQSGTIGGNQFSLLETAVEGPGTLSFYWKVSSEANFDFLRFSINGQEQNSRSGNFDWEIQSYNITAGPHTLQWRYTKDGSVDDNQDAAWVDQVVWNGSGGGSDNPTPTPPDSSDNALGTGPGGNTKTGIYEYGSDYGNLSVEVSPDGNTCTMETDQVKTIDLNHGSTNSSSVAFSYPCLRNTHKAINGAYSPLNDAHYFGGVVYEMYDQWYNTAPLTFQLKMKVHYSNNYENAFWDGSSMTFGDGQNYFYPLVSLDVVSHEVSHGFTDQNSDLVYSGQSGGINEAFSDIAGEAAEFFMLGSNDFKVGATIFKGSGALRYMYNPPLDGRSVGHANDFSSGMDVHYSSGIFNKAFYLLANTSGWDVRKGFEVFLRANQNYWTSTTDFEQGCLGVRDAANDAGYSTDDVEAAFAQVGLCPAYVPPAPVDLDVALDNSQITWSSDGDGDWIGQVLTSYDGEDAAQSAEITHDQETTLQATLTGPGTLNFHWKVSSEANYDFLKFYINGHQQASRSGNVDWEQQTYQIPSGSHTVQWKYTKDGSVDRSQDAAWVDHVQWTSN